jgi:predicted transposase YbfD/YdcC
MKKPKALHWVRDETFAEDKSRIRTRHGPRQAAAVRNAALALYRISSR